MSSWSEGGGIRFLHFLALGDLEFPSVCCECVLLPLVNKEAAFGQWLNRVNPGRKSDQRCRERESRQSQREAMEPQLDRHLMDRTLPVGYILTTIHRLIEMG